MRALFGSRPSAVGVKAKKSNRLPMGVALAFLLVQTACADLTTSTPEPVPTSAPTRASTPTSLATVTPTPTAARLSLTPTPVTPTRPGTGCERAGQSPGRTDFDPSILELASGSRSQQLDESAPEMKINARLLTTSPFVLEVLGELAPLASYGNRVQRLAVTETASSHIAELSFDDLIEATTHMELYAPPGGELGLRTVVKRVRRLGDPPVSPTPTLDRDRSPSQRKVLIGYLPGGNGANEFLFVYQGGALYYKDAQNNILTGQSLSRVQLDELLSTFSENHFDELESSIDLETWEDPSVELICSRFQKVLIVDNEEEIKPVTDALDTIISNLQEHFDFVITYGEKTKIALLPWPFTEVQLADLNRLHDQALAESRRVGRLADDHIAYRAVPQDLLEQVPSASSNKTSYVFFIDQEKIFLVSKRRCIPDSFLCKDGTFYILSAREIKEHDGRGDGFGLGTKLWPGDVGLDLIMVPNDGSLLTETTYGEHREFYDRFFEFLHGDTTFIQGDYMFESVEILKKER